MAESDQSEGEPQAKQAPPELAKDSNEPTHKRLREESSEDEKVEVPAKKLCNPSDNSSPVKQDVESTEINGTTEDAEHRTDEKPTEDKEDTDKSLPLEKEDKIKQDAPKTHSQESGEEGDVKQENGIDKSDKASEESTDIENKEDSASKEAVTKTESESTADEEEKEKESKADNGKNIIKSETSGSEVVGGLELSVECASDKESSPSESENEKEKKPKPKTIIVKAEPNESELEVSLSEGEKSDSQEATEATTPRKTAKKGKRKGSRTSFSKRSTGSEVSHDDVSDDEDYSPVSKKKARKTPSKRGAKTSPESRRGGRGRGRKSAAKPAERKPKQEEEEEENEDAMSNKNDEQFSDAESVGSKSKTDNESGSEKDGRRQRRGGGKQSDDKRIEALKRYIRAAGIRVKSYNELWTTCESNAAKVRCLKELLEKNGVTGRPTLEKCKKARLKNEQLKDISELNTSNIITGGRVTRARRNMDHNKDSKTSESPPKQREARTTFKRIMNVVDSDSE